MIDTAVRFFQEGGFFMFPIAVVLIVGLIVAIERYVYLSAQKLTNRRDFNRLHQMIAKRDLKGALNYTQESGSAMSTMIGFGLQRLARRQGREEIEYAMEEGLLDVMPRLEKAYPVSGHAGQHCHAARPAGYHYWVDCSVYRGSCSGSGPEGEPSVPEYLGCHEHHRLRPYVCNSHAADPLTAADQDQ